MTKKPVSSDRVNPTRRAPSAQREKNLRARYSVDLPLDLEQRVAALAAERGEQKSDVVRRAISYFLKCEELRQSGYEFQGIKKDGSNQVSTVSIVTT